MKLKRHSAQISFVVGAGSRFPELPEFYCDGQWNETTPFPSEKKNTSVMG